MYRIVVGFSDLSVLEGYEIRDSRRFWRRVSKICKHWDVRVTYVNKEVL